MTSHQNITAIPLKRKKMGENNPHLSWNYHNVRGTVEFMGLNFVLLYFSALQSRSVHHCIRGNCRVAILGALNAMFGSCCHFLGTCDCWCGRCCSGRGEKYQGGSEGRRRKERSFGGMGRWKRGLPWLWTACCSTPSDLSHRVFLCQLGRIVKAINEDEKYYQRWRYTAKTIASIYC